MSLILPIQQNKTVPNETHRITYFSTNRDFGTEHDAMMKLLYDSKTAPSGIEKLFEAGAPALISLEKLITTSEDIIAKGWAIQASHDENLRF